MRDDVFAAPQRGRDDAFVLGGRRFEQFLCTLADPAPVVLGAADRPLSGGEVPAPASFLLDQPLPLGRHARQRALMLGLNPPHVRLGSLAQPSRGLVGRSTELVGFGLGVGQDLLDPRPEMLEADGVVDGGPATQDAELFASPVELIGQAPDVGGQLTLRRVGYLDLGLDPLRVPVHLMRVVATEGDPERRRRHHLVEQRQRRGLGGDGAAAGHRVPSAVARGALTGLPDGAGVDVGAAGTAGEVGAESSAARSPVSTVDALV